MKLLENEEMKAIDSKDESLQKWYDWIQTAGNNAGYGTAVLDHIKPWKDSNYQGLDMANGDKLKPNNNGRLIFKRSLADKIMTLMAQPAFRNCRSTSLVGLNRYLFMLIAQSSILTVQRPEETEQEYKARLFDEGVYLFLRDDTEIRFYMADLHKNRVDYLAPVDFVNGLNYAEFTPQHKRLWLEYMHEYDRLAKLKEDFVEDVFIDNIRLPGYTSLAEKIREIETQSAICKRNNKEVARFLQKKECARLDYLYVGAFDEIFDTPITSNYFAYTGANPSEREAQFINEKYMVVSLNPVDKLMCSTKQAFGSCLSFAREGANMGTNGISAVNSLGIFALLPSNKIYLTFYTNGKHKNMYWTKEEWDKLPEDRDPSKAYKYFKMTARQWTYQVKEQETNRITRMDEIFDKERLLPARVYSVVGEEFVWETLTALQLERFGLISDTSISNALHNNDTFNSYFLNTDDVPDDGLPNPIVGKIDANDTKAVAFDKYGYRRGIYFDNVLFDEHNSAPNWYSDVTPTNVMLSVSATVKVGQSRLGSMGISQSNIASDLDTFKLLAGEQTYTSFNQQVKICAKCGKVIRESATLSYNSEIYCNECAEQYHLVKCELCNRVYSALDADEVAKHEIIDATEIFNEHPELIEEDKHIKICKEKLKDISLEANITNIMEQSNSYSTYIDCLCFGCGKFEKNYQWISYNSDNKRQMIEAHIRKNFNVITIDDEEYVTHLCTDCLQDAVICSYCGKLIPMKGGTEPLLLLPNRRVACMDCVKKIRMKKKEKEHIEEAMKILAEWEVPEDVQEELINKVDMATENYLKEIEKDLTNMSVYGRCNRLMPRWYHGTTKKRVKDIEQQIQALTCRTGKGYPKIKPMMSGLTEEVTVI